MGGGGAAAAAAGLSMVIVPTFLRVSCFYDVQARARRRRGLFSRRWGTRFGRTSGVAARGLGAVQHHGLHRRLVTSRPSSTTTATLRLSLTLMMMAKSRTSRAAQSKSSAPGRCGRVERRGAMGARERARESAGCTGELQRAPVPSDGLNSH